MKKTLVCLVGTAVLFRETEPPTADEMARMGALIE